MSRASSFWRLRNGDFDARHGVLRIGTRTIELDRSGCAILSLLLQNAGTPVAKTRLLEVGWPATIVHENSLAKAIGRLREALGESAACLKAVYGVGYKLESAILASPEPPAEGKGIPRTRLANGLFKPRPALVSLAALVCMAVVALAFGVPSSAWRPEAGSDHPPMAIGDAPDSIGKILWVDDHPENNIAERRFFERHRIAVHTVTNSTDALNLLQMYDYKAVISDMGRGQDRLAGARFVRQMRAKRDPTTVIIYTAGADSPSKQQAQMDLVSEAGAQGLAIKPAQIRSIVLRLFGDPPERPDA